MTEGTQPAEESRQETAGIHEQCDILVAMNTYLIHGKDIYRQELVLQEILKKNHVEKDQIRTIDASDKKTFRIEEVLLACDNVSLFSDGQMRAVIVDRPYYLNAAVKYAEAVKKTDSPSVKTRKEKELRDREYRLDLLRQYLKAPDPDTILVFFCRDYTADSRKKDYKLLKDTGVTIIEEKKLTRSEFRQFVRDMLKKAGIILKDDALQELILRTDQDTMLVKNAMDSIVLYGEKQLSRKDITYLVPMPQEVQMYSLADAVMKGNTQEALRIRRELSLRNISVSAMVSSMGSSVRRMYNMKCMDEEYYDPEVIAAKLKTMDWLVRNQLKEYRHSSADLLKWMNELAEMDQGIKSGQIEDPVNVLELWIISRSAGDRYGS